ncbi:hypothetical protein VM98_33840, partial [Streptomyces rubellomurinus subsp. indigoferus]
PGTDYRAFDLMDAGADRIQQILTELGPPFAAGTLAPLPVTTSHVRAAVPAFRHLGQARHTVNAVLAVLQELPEGGERPRAGVDVPLGQRGGHKGEAPPGAGGGEPLLVVEVAGVGEAVLGQAEGAQHRPLGG